MFMAASFPSGGVGFLTVDGDIAFLRQVVVLLLAVFLDELVRGHKEALGTHSWV